MAKGIGNGFPLAAVVTTKEISQALTKAAHFNTFGGGAIASTVGLAVLDVRLYSKRSSHELKSVQKMDVPTKLERQWVGTGIGWRHIEKSGRVKGKFISGNGF